MTGTPSRTPPTDIGPPHRLRPACAVPGVLVVLAAMFIAQHRDLVPIHLFSATLSAPLWLLLTIAALVVAAVGALLRARP